METNTAIKLTLITKKAKEEPKLKFISLMHLLNKEYLKSCFKELKHGKAAGIDGRRVESYTDEEIQLAIEETIQHIKDKSYRPQPVKRVQIPKGDGKTRPLGIPTVIDKLVQLGITKILESIYEPTFLSVSYGYRKGINAHAALKQINHMIMGKKVNWIIEADIEGFFDHIDHKWMMRCLSERIKDPNFKKLIKKFLKAGIMKDGRYLSTTEGTPQGGNLSPILANIYLHYVLDLWFEKQMKQPERGYTELVRYADDFVIGVQHRVEAEKIQRDLNNRFGKFGLTLSKTKTKVVEFGRFAKENQWRKRKRKPETFDFLGFTHYCTTTRDGRFMVKVKTSRKRKIRATGTMNSWLKTIRNKVDTKEIWKTLALKLTGHYQYYGISGNFEGIKWYYHKTLHLTLKWMNRRSRKKSWNFDEFRKYLLQNPLPIPKLQYAIYNTW